LIRRVLRDKDYWASLVRLALPITAQNLISSSLNVVGVVMVGQLGEKSVAAVGLANQVFFIFSFLLFGISSGAAIFTAQLWGKKDQASIRKVLGLCLSMGLGGALLFSAAALLFPGAVLRIYSHDPAVIELGVQYLRIIGWSYAITAVTFSFASVLRSTGNVRVPTFVSICAICLDALLNYVLIFGKLGLPAMGVRGAALGTSIARLFEVTLLLGITYRMRLPAAAGLTELLGASRSFVRTYLITALPVAFNESMWALGISTYNMIYARIGTESIAAVNIASTIEGLAFTIFVGICNASAIMIGHKIGSNQEGQALSYARRALAIAASGAVLVGVLIVLGSDAILSFYKVSQAASQYAHNILIVLACVLWIRVSNMTMIVAILRSGGDTRFSLFLDVGTVWGIGVPLALLGAFVFHLPVYWVVSMVMTEEVAKLVIGFFRFKSRKWINNLAQAAA
jgi:putative MATE family efflux protein